MFHRRIANNHCQCTTNGVLPLSERQSLQGVFWGTHLHTSYSANAGFVGTTLGPEEAYRFARSEEIITSTGVRARLRVPLDFLVAADHAENMALAPLAAEGDPVIIATEFGREVHELMK